MLSTKAKIRVARTMSNALCAVRSRVGLSSSVTVKRGGLSWSLDLREGIDLAIYLGVYERETTRAIRRLVTSGNVALDIGANIGAHTLELARRVGPDGKVVAFEPTAYAVGRLRRNVELNPSVDARIVIEQAMVTTKEGALPEHGIYSRWPLYQSDELHATHLGKLESTTGARTVSVDEYLAEHEIRRVDFIKLDVDGFECEVLGGARDCLSSMRPVIVLELAPYVLRERGTSLAAMMSHLERSGHRLYDLAGSPLPTRAEDLERAIPIGGGINAVARASARPLDASS